jgi:hypothetical protein
MLDIRKTYDRETQERLSVPELGVRSADAALDRQYQKYPSMRQICHDRHYMPYLICFQL